jgi:hypothetical protein
MGNLTTKQIKNLTAPGAYEDSDRLRLLIKSTGKKEIRNVSERVKR